MMMQETIISLSFDDGREDTYRNAFMIMKEYNLIGTIHVTTGYVDKTWSNDSWKSCNEATTVDNLKIMKEKGMEISSHGDKHITDIEDLKVSISKLREWELINEKVGFSIPNSKLSQEKRYELNEMLKQHSIIYVRGGRNELCYTAKSKVMFFLYKITKIQYFYNYFNKYNLMDIHDKNKVVLNSVVIRYEDNEETVIKLIKKNLNKKKWIILMFHSIQEKEELTYGSDPWCWDAKKFRKLCKEFREMIDKNQISVMPISEVINIKI